MSKYLKKNISKCRLHIWGSFRRTPRHCAKWLQNSPGRRYRQIRICLTKEVETPSFPIWICLSDVKYPEKVERHPTEFRMWDIWVECRQRRIPDVRISVRVERKEISEATPSGFPKRASLSGSTPSGFLNRARGACKHHTPER